MSAIGMLMSAFSAGSGSIKQILKFHPGDSHHLIQSIVTAASKIVAMS
jgi:hypothetical protein